MSLTVIHHTKTRHILAAITGTGLADEPQLSDLTGPGGVEVHQRTRQSSVSALLVPSDQLTLAVLDDVDDVPDAPLGHALQQDGKRLETLNSNAPDVTVDAKKVTVKRGPAAAGADVIVVISAPASTGTSESTVLTGKTTTATTLTLTADLDPETYVVLTLVTGLRGHALRRDGHMRSPAPPGPDLVIERCTVDVIRAGGWSWGPDPDRLVQRVIDSVTGLLADHLTSVTGPDAADAGRDVLIAEPLRVDVEIGLDDLLTGRTGSITLLLPDGQGVTLHPDDPPMAAPASPPTPRQSSPEQISHLAYHPADPLSEPSMAALLIELQARGEAAALVELLPHPVQTELITLLAAERGSEHRPDIIQAQAILLQALLATGQLEVLLDLVSLDTLEAWRLYLPAYSAVAAPEGAEVDIRAATVALDAAITRHRTRAVGHPEHTAHSPRPEAAAAPAHTPGATEERGSGTGPMVEVAVLPASPTPETETAPPPATPPVAVPDEASEIALDSVLPFLLVVPLARSGLLDAVLPALSAVHRNDDEIITDAGLLAAALACTVLGPLQRGWRRDPADRTAAAAFADRLALPDAEIARLIAPDRPGRSAAAILDGVIALTLCRGHSPGRLLLLTEVSPEAGGGLLLCDEEGLFPIAWTDELDLVIRHWTACGRPPVLLGTPGTHDLLTAPAPVHMDALSAAGVRVATTFAPVRGQRLERLPGRRSWVTPGQPVEPGTAAALNRLPVQLSRTAALIRALAVDRRAVPNAPMAGLARTVTLMAALGLGTLSWLMWKDREAADPLLALERLADLSGVVHRDRDRVIVRIPLGRRHSDLLRAGLLTEVREVPWLGGRTLSVTGG